MGGNAIKNIDIRRINRECISETLKYVSDTLEIENLTYGYMFENLMGSAGKQPDSGDLDIALNNRSPMFVGEPDLPIFSLRDISNRCREILGDDFVISKHLRHGQINTAWPIRGNRDNGYVQIDFLSGNPEWLKFSHFSPGLDNSQWKGVAISTMFGILCHVRKDFEKFEDGTVFFGDDCQKTFVLKDGVARIARVGLLYDLENGVFRSWEMVKRDNQGASRVDPDYFETHISESPRFTRIGYVDCPKEALRLMFRCDVDLESVNTFEKLVKVVKEIFPDQYEEIKIRFANHYYKSGSAKRTMTIDEILKSDVW